MNIKEFREFLTEGINDPAIFKAVFILGAPGSGKSFVTKKIAIESLGFKLTDSDTIFEYLLKSKNKGKDLSKLSPEEFEEIRRIRRKALGLNKTRISTYIDNRLGIIIIGTGSDSFYYIDTAEYLRDIGYDTLLIYINTPLETSLERNRARERNLKDTIVQGKWKDLQSNIGKFQKNFGKENTIIVDNETVDEEVFTDVYKQLVQFAKKPITNHKAKQWIERERNKRK